MKPHPFIFSPGIWKGEGHISFTIAEDVLPFVMQWRVFEKEQNLIRFSQVVEVQSFQEPLHNHFTLSDITENTFQIGLENHLVGRVKGKGLYEENKIAWEFRAIDKGFEGFEIYDLVDENTYKMHAEFLGGEGFRTLISGYIKKIS